MQVFNRAILIRYLSTGCSPYLRSKALVKSLNCSTDEAKLLLKKENLKDLHPQDITERVATLQKYEINSSLIKDNIWLLEEDSSNLTEKASLLKELPLKPSEIIKLMKHSSVRIKKLYNMFENDRTQYDEDRISYLSKHLNTAADVICEKFCKHQVLTRISFKKIKDVMEVLKKYNMPSDSILRDIWIFSYNSQEVDQQLKKVTQADIGYLKPWMGRCQEYKIKRLLERIHSQQDLLGDQSLEEYLSERLGSNVENIQVILKHYPNVAKIDIRKLKEMLDCLFFNEYTSTQILLALPRITKRSVLTVNTRVSELRQLGLFPCSIYVLCKTQKEYADYLSKNVALLKKKIVMESKI